MSVISWLFPTCFFIVFSKSYSENLPPSCDSPVYCYGELLDTVQRARIFNDSKTFVDLKMRRDVNTTLNNFEEFMKSTNRRPTKQQVRTFVSDNFEDGDELQTWNPPDYNPNPKFLNKIDSEVVRNFAKYVVEIWPTLARKIKPDVIKNEQLYSIISLPNGFIIPGGRFREIYYWDTYWIIQGLLISEMEETARGMIENLISLVERYGLIPNGGRIYYLKRSQPPLLTSMAYSYIKQTKNLKWLKKNIKYLDDELSYWLKRMTTVEKDGQKYSMAHYLAISAGPRPESYREDLIVASYFPDKRSQQEFYIKIKSGAESGWDFSSRWIFDGNGGNVANLTFIDTPRVIPVDLNSFLCRGFGELSTLYNLIGDERNTYYWKEKHLSLLKSIEKVLWNEEDGIWYDFDNNLSKHRKYFYPSNVAPLWTGSYNLARASIIGQRVLHYLKKTNALDYPGGIPTSSDHTGEQWDFPNAWAPLQGIIIQGLYKTGNPEARKVSKELADKWISANMRGYRETGEMYEKYDALHSGKYGGGGEYVVQTGFGWTNGVVLELIKQFKTNETSPVRHAH